MEYRLQTLSPVHIGSGRTIEPFEYIAEKGRYYRVNLDAFVNKAYENDPEAPDKLSKWITETTEKIDSLEAQRKAAGRAGSSDYNRQLSELRRDFSLLAFCRNIKGYESLARQLLDEDGLSHYSCPTHIGQRYLLKEQIKTADFQPYIPGSSVKGAIRTALAHLALTELGQEIKEQIRDGVGDTDIRGLTYFLGRVDKARSGRDRAKLKEDAGTDLEKVLFMCGLRKERQIIYSDVHYDLMKFVSISDTYDPKAGFVVPQVHTFLKKRTREGETYLDAQVPILMEALRDDSSFSIRFEVDAAFIKQAGRMACQEDWIGLPEKIKRIFGISLDEAEGMSEEEIEGRVVGRILEACRHHAAAVVAEEMKWAGRFRPEEVEQIPRFYRRLQTLPEGVTPIRTGWGSHFMTTTLLLALREDDVLRPSLEKLVKVFKLDLTRQQENLVRDLEGRRINLDEFPRSRRLVSVNRKPTVPLGWIALRLPDAPPAPKLVEMDALMAEQRAEPEPVHVPGGQGKRPDRPYGGGQRGRREEMRFEAPARRPEPPITIKPLPRPEPKTTDGTKIQKGDTIGAEVLSCEGGRVRVRLTGASGEEIAFPATRAFQAGQKIKVKVETVDKDGRILKVRI